MDRLLPPVKFMQPPSPEVGRELARELIEKVSPQLGGLVIVKMIIEQQGWQTGYTDTIPETSTVESLLIPLLTGGFTIALNPHLLPEEPDARLRHEAFLTAHEIAHTMFYSDRPGQVPRPIARQLAGPEEEAFCDEFGRPFSEY